MKNSLCNRRSFLTTTVLASATLVGPGALAAHWLETPEAFSKVFSILKEHLGLQDEHKTVVAEFTRSLQSSARHHLSAKAFQAKLKTEAGKDENELSLYIVQEFMVTSNYLAYHNGLEKSLRLLPRK